MEYLLISSGHAAFQDDSIFSTRLAEAFPGAQWVPYFKKIASSAGFQVLSNYSAERLLESGRRDEASISIFQEEHSEYARRLRSRGAHAAVISSLESPLYAGRFYRNLEAEASPFDFALMFSGIFQSLSVPASTVNVFFPSFDRNHLSDVNNPRLNRIAFVVGNKYWKRLGVRPQQLLRRAKDQIMRPNYVPEASEHQLHDKRLEFICYFADRGLSLFGDGWHDLSNIPKRFHSPIESSSARKGRLEYAKKIETLSAYRFAACIENYALDGYVTEKIFDALVAGCIPVYLGAPNVQELIPPDVFVDARKFGTNQELDRYLLDLSPAGCKALRENGRDFLASPKGKRFSYQGFAEGVLNLMTL